MLLFRSCAYFFWFALVTAFIAIGFLPSLLLPGSVMRFGARLWCRGQLFGLRVIAGQDVVVQGMPPQGGRLIAAKHMSMLDTLVLFLQLRDVVIVLKRELAFVPFYGWYAWKVGFIFIDREGGASALRHMTVRARKAIETGRSILIFPEGTRKKPGASPDYKPGVAALYRQLNVPCVPVALNSGLFWTGPMGFLKRPGTVKVAFLPAIPPGMQRRDFESALEQEIETATGQLLANPAWNLSSDDD